MAGRGTPGDLKNLEQWGDLIKTTSRCGFGQTSPNPVLTTLRYFRDEYEAHINEKRCPAKACRALISYLISDATCNGCGVCKRICPVSAISGERRQPHVIDQSMCTRCGLCQERCRFNAISVE